MHIIHSKNVFVEEELQNVTQHISIISLHFDCK